MKKKDVRSAHGLPVGTDAEKVMDAVLDALEKERATRNCAGELLESLKRRAHEEKDEKSERTITGKSGEPETCP